MYDFPVMNFVEFWIQAGLQGGFVDSLDKGFRGIMASKTVLPFRDQAVMRGFGIPADGPMNFSTGFTCNIAERFVQIKRQDDRLATWPQQSSTFPDVAGVCVALKMFEGTV